MFKVSVVVPIYGVERYIERCARSLFEQSLNDIEFIFVNDGTKDNSVLVLNNVVKQYPGKNVKIINHDRNKGLPEARKSGIAVATGDYIINCDSDDWAEPDYCKHLYERAISTNSDIVICDYWKSSNGKNEEDTWGLPSMYKSSEIAFRNTLALLAPCNVWNKLVRRDIAQRTDIAWPVSYMAEDWVLSVQWFYYSKSISYLNEHLYHYCIDNVSLSRSLSSDLCRLKCIEQERNVCLINKWLKKNRIRFKFHHELSRAKLVTKDNLIPVLSDKRCYKQWKKTFNEINILILFNKYLDFQTKHKYLIRLLGSPYIFLIKFVHFFRNNR